MLVNGLIYYLWVVRDVNTGFVPFFMITEARSGLDVIVLVNNMRRIKIKILDKELDDYYIHDGLPAYNYFSLLKVKHEHVRFGKRNVVEQVFRSVKHRLSVMDFHFPWNSSKTSLKAWFGSFLLIFNLTLSVYKR
ncbi:hypothetical protein SJAV_17700 [Sulfurisphaera javensis]|uniref:Transposase n=1 Tax=Sulfurisphaera javensis TaxID=2049879 RepID=A0AAT9GSI1_9CREN